MLSFFKSRIGKHHRLFFKYSMTMKTNLSAPPAASAPAKEHI